MEYLAPCTPTPSHSSYDLETESVKCIPPSSLVCPQASRSAVMLGYTRLTSAAGVAPGSDLEQRLNFQNRYSSNHIS